MFTTEGNRQRGGGGDSIKQKWLTGEGFFRNLVRDFFVFERKES